LPTSCRATKSGRREYADLPRSPPINRRGRDLGD
jgi:hypothetical protein